MKKIIVPGIVSIVIIMIILTILSIYNTNKNENQIDYSKLYNNEWQRVTDSDTEILVFMNDGSFSYKSLSSVYVDDFSSCNKYDLDSKEIICVDGNKLFNINRLDDDILDISIEDKNYYFSSSSIRDNDYSLYKVGYISNIKNKNVVLSSFNDFKDYFEKYCNYIYDENGNTISDSLDELFSNYGVEYFNINNLAVLYVETSSSGDSFDSISVKKSNDTVDIVYSIKHPEMGTMDKSGYFILVSVDKEISKITGNKV